MVNWTPDKDRTILKGIFAFHDIKNSQPFLEFLAKEIGEGCTPKAVSHRLTNLRKSGEMVNSGGSRSTPTRKAPRTPSSGRGCAKASSAKKTIDNDTTSGDDDNEPVASPSVGRKHARTSAAPRSYAESDAATDDGEDEFAPMNKKVKTEPVEDEGIGGSTSTNSLLEEEGEGVAFI